MNYLVTLFISTAIHSVFHSITSTLAQNECDLYFEEQPPEELSCNPYGQRVLMMECTVHGSMGKDFELLWFSRYSSEGENVGPNSSMVQNSTYSRIRYQYRHDAEVKRIRSRLQLELQSSGPTSSIVFWCSVTLNTNTTLLRSKEFVLYDPEHYTDLPVCEDTVHSLEEEKRCANGSGSSVEATITTSPIPSSITPTLTISSSTTHTTSSSSTSSSFTSSSSFDQGVTPSVVAKGPGEELRKGQDGLGTIVFPILCTMAGALGTLSLLTVFYLHCHYKHKKKNGKSRKQEMVEATYHTYSVPDTLSSSPSSHPKITEEKEQNEALSFSSSSSSLPTTDGKLEDSQATVYSHDQYIEMAGVSNQRITASHSSCPTLQRTGLLSSLSDYSGLRQGFSYEVPIPLHMEPVYATIPSPYVPYLIPVQTKIGIPRSSINRQLSLKLPRRVECGMASDQPSISAPSSPPPTPGHDYEELIHTANNRAYHRLKVLSSEQDSNHYMGLVPASQQQSNSSKLPHIIITST